MEKIYYSKQIRRRRRYDGLRTILAFLILFGLVIGLLFAAYKIVTFSTGILGTTAPTPTPEHFPTPTPTPVVLSRLGQVVEEALSGSRGSYGISIKNLKTGEAYTQGDTISYESASLYKLWVMAVVYQQIKDGKLSEEDKLSQDIATLNKKFNIATDAAELTDGKVSMTVGEALTQMITISDNYAALLLTERVKVPSLTAFLKANDLNGSAVGTGSKLPTTTAHDVMLFLDKLYMRQLADEEYTLKMLELLKQQRLNTKVPKYLPLAVQVAHKTGEIDEYTHDGGIVNAPSGDYIIVVMSKSDDPNVANERIAQVSKAVYNYFEEE